jgi:hypothetical protein
MRSLRAEMWEQANANGPVEVGGHWALTLVNTLPRPGENTARSERVSQSSNSANMNAMKATPVAAIRASATMLVPA